MISRYDYMESSKVFDIDGESFPDPLSVAYNNVELTKLPSKKSVSSVDIAKFWLFMYNNYNIQEKDDILLGLNGIPYIGMLEPGDDIFLVDSTDLDNFNSLASAEDE